MKHIKRSETISDVFKMPTPMSIYGRSSSITAAFVTSIVPQIKPSDDEIKYALKLLGMNPDNINCAYCGASTSEWDHLRPLVSKQKATGFITEIRNLVPSCGKCNQSKGNKNWKEWINSNAKYSPRRRNVHDLQRRIERLQEYERWGNTRPLDLQSMVAKDMWDEHWINWRNILEAMAKAQAHSLKIRRIIEDKTRDLFKK